MDIDLSEDIVKGDTGITMGITVGIMVTIPVTSINIIPLAITGMDMVTVAEAPFTTAGRVSCKD